MPKFKVCVQQFVEQIGVVEIEAATPEDAVQAYKGDRTGHDVVWQQGEDTQPSDAYAVMDATGATVWER